jgi:hypothetical protein
MRARLLEMALSAYPSQVRSERGEEMRGTALDLSRGSFWLFARETLELVRGGLRARVRITTAVGSKRLVGDVLAQAVTVWGVLALTETLRTVTTAHWNPVIEEEIYVGLLAVSVALALFGYDRLAGLCGWGWIFVLLYLTQTPFVWRTGASFTLQPLGGVILRSLIPAVCYTAMILLPRSRRRDLRRLVWLVGPAAVALAAPFNFGIGLEAAVLLAVLAGGLVRLPADPRLAMACALVLSEVELSRWVIGARPFNSALLLSWVLVSAPVVFGACVLRLYTARESGCP